MSSAKFTLIGTEIYFNNINQSLFDNLTIPQGLTKQTLVDTILMRGGEFEVQYGNPEFLRKLVGPWSQKYMPTMQRWVDALAIDYNPLENYDRMEDWTDDSEGSGASTSQSVSDRHSTRDSSSIADHSGVTNGSRSGNQETITDRDKYSSPPTLTRTKSAYDSTSYQPLEQDTETGKWSENGSSSSSEQTSEAGSQTGAENAIEDDDITVTDNNSSVLNNNSVHSGRIHGNIGVTTSQQMLLQELELGYWNIYEKITELFLQEFTIPVYI